MVIRKSKLLIISALFPVISVSLIYASIFLIFGKPKIIYDECFGFSRLYSLDEIGMFLPREITLPERLGNSSLAGVAFWNRTGDRVLYVYYIGGQKYNFLVEIT